MKGSANGKTEINKSDMSLDILKREHWITESRYEGSVLERDLLDPFEYNA